MGAQTRLAPKNILTLFNATDKADFQVRRGFSPARDFSRPSRPKEKADHSLPPEGAERSVIRVQSQFELVNTEFFLYTVVYTDREQGKRDAG